MPRARYLMPPATPAAPSRITSTPMAIFPFRVTMPLFLDSALFNQTSLIHNSPTQYPVTHNRAGLFAVSRPAYFHVMRVGVEFWHCSSSVMPLVMSVQAATMAMRSASVFVVAAPLRHVEWPLNPSQTSTLNCALPNVD